MLDVYAMKSQSQQQAKMALTLVDSAVSVAQQVNQAGGALHAPTANINVTSPVPGANPGDRLGENIDISV
jgi:hypothetical protein